MEERFDFISHSCTICDTQLELLDKSRFVGEDEFPMGEEEEASDEISIEMTNNADDSPAGIVICSAPMETAESEEAESSDKEEEEERYVTPDEHLLITSQSQNNHSQNFQEAIEKFDSIEIEKRDESEIVDVEGVSSNNPATQPSGTQGGSPSTDPALQQFVSVEDLIDCGDDEDDLLVIAIKAGMKFPRPRWWTPEGYGRRSLK